MVKYSVKSMHKQFSSVIMHERVNIDGNEYFMKLPSMDSLSQVWLGSVSQFSFETHKSGGTASTKN